MLFQVALDAIEELCFEMSLHRPEAIEEYAIFVVTHRGKLQLSHFKKTNRVNILKTSRL